MSFWLSVWVLEGSVQPLGQTDSVALSVLVARLLEVVFLSTMVPAVAKA